MRVSIVVVSAALVLAALLVSSCETAPQQAQVDARKPDTLKPDNRRAAVAIEVTRPKGDCRYELKTVYDVQLSDAEHDRFEIYAGGFLSAMAKGTSAQIRIADDPVKKKKGYDKKGVVSLRDGDEDFLRIRKAKKNDPDTTLHKVWIHCCQSLGVDPSKDAKGGGVVCVDSVQADDLTSPGSNGGRMNSASIMPLEGLLDGSLLEEEPESVPPGPGGPDMDVHP